MESRTDAELVKKLKDSTKNPHECDHGRLARKCEICELEAEKAELLTALNDLLVWALWMQKRHKTPQMGEPNTGAITQARNLLQSMTGEGPIS